MARLVDPPGWTGTFGPVCVYKLRGEYYVRTKSSLSSKRVKNAPEFAKTRMYAGWLAQASKIASKVYHSQPSKDKQLYRYLTGQAMQMLKAGMNADEIVEVLRKTP